MLQLATPAALVLLPLPLLLRLLPPAPPQSGLRVPAGIAARLQAGGTEPDGAAARPAALPWLCWVALVLALAGPQVARPSPALPASGRDIMLALDLSGSMERRDFRLDGAPSRRVDVVRRAADEFIARRAGDRIGLVLFAEQAYVAAPLSFDLAGVRDALAEVEIGLAGRSTAIGDGLGLAVKRLRAAPGPSRLVVLLSDGSNNAGAVRPADAARLARDLGVRVDTIAFGSESEEDGTPSDLDPEALAAIARQSGGRAFRVRTTEELDRVYDTIDALEGSPARAPPAVVAEALWPYPAALALIACLAVLWPGWRPR